MDPEVAGSSPVGRPFSNTYFQRPIFEIIQYIFASLFKLTLIDAILLGIVQGITEFLPLSSSGHLKLFQYILGLKNLDNYILFDLACHLGTLLAIVYVFSKPLCDIFLSDRLRLKQLALATGPLFPLVAFMKPIKAIYSDPSFLGFFFILNSFILFLGCYFSCTSSQNEKKKHPLIEAFCVGISQAVAIFPGISRSGSTISCARILGWSAEEAVTFSFLMAIPAILGGTVLELFNLFNHPETVISVSPLYYLAGFIVSFFVGLVSLKLLIQLAIQNKFLYFAVYCLFLGVLITCYFYL